MIRLSHIETQSKIVDFIVKNGRVSIGLIQSYLKTVTRPTLSRYLKELKESCVITQIGNGRSATYEVTRGVIVSYPFDLSVYDSMYQTAVPIHFDHTRFKFNKNTSLFSTEDHILLQEASTLFTKWNTHTDTMYKSIALERCAIEFSWKSSRIEGNTYTLLETENLIKNKEEARGKTHDEAVMILNQKKVFDSIYLDTLFTKVNISTLIDIHALLVKDLPIPTGIRKTHVGITGTQYAPLTLQSQLSEALEDLFLLLNKIEHPIEQAIVALASIAYIQPFADGNKRASRHFANLILHTHNLAPVAWRTVDEVIYKKAMIAFYELGNIAPIKDMWVKHYIETVRTFFSR